jgi:hypothetical protein
MIRSVAGFEYYTNPTARTSGHITWISEGEESWTLYPAAIGPNAETNISQRLISEEPMAMVRYPSTAIRTSFHAEICVFVACTVACVPFVPLNRRTLTPSHSACLFAFLRLILPVPPHLFPLLIPCIADHQLRHVHQLPDSQLQPAHMASTAPS